MDGLESIAVVFSVLRDTRCCVVTSGKFETLIFANTPLSSISSELTALQTERCVHKGCSGHSSMKPATVDEVEAPNVSARLTSAYGHEMVDVGPNNMAGTWCFELLSARRVLL
jgi:hypothetical protein